MCRRQLVLLVFSVLLIESLGEIQSEYRQRRQFQNAESNKMVNLTLLNGNQPSAVRSNVANPKQADRPALATSLVDSEECKADIIKYCGKGKIKTMTNIRALQCIDELDDAVNLINRDCQNLIYEFKYNMTHNIRFDETANKLCSNDINKLEECNELRKDRGEGRLITCLYDLIDNITGPTCRNFLQQIQSMIFTDWRLSEPFTESCLSDIKKLECGRLDVENTKLGHEQGAVISCLSKKQKDLSTNCSKHIMRLAELQSDDYHLDRPLFYACREDRERFCSQVSSGNGRVYRCLYEQKFNSLMSSDCREEIHRRQKMVATNAKLDAPLIRACKGEMIEHKCEANIQESNNQLTLVDLLVCLEQRLKSGNSINDVCRREMLIHRRMLMSDYAVSPQIISQCKNEMFEHCPKLYRSGASGTIDQRGGRMIHCLLSAARKTKNFSFSCLSTIKSLVRAVDPGSDIRADPLLETTCRPVIDVLCSKVKPGDSNVIMCLLDNLKNTRMTEECEDRLMEITYFMVRDWRLTPRLMQTCRNNLINFCQLPQDMNVDEKMNDVRIGKYLSCLYENKQKLDNDCRSELRQLMRLRAQSVGLLPDVEDNCITDLATCKNHDVKGEEMKCLQKKYKTLEPECRAAVQKFTKMTMVDPSLDFLLTKACEPMIQLFCSNANNGNDDDLIRCLIRQKSNTRMDYRCKAGIEHHQITSMKDEAFLSDSFRKKCTQEISEHCSGKKTKSAVVQCLANIMLKDVLKNENRITQDCRDELKFELLQRSENINFDPLLARACQNDIRLFCSSKNPGNAQVLDCLKVNRNKVSTTCFRLLKQRQKLDVVVPDNDYSLTTKCSSVIQKFCVNERKQDLLSCLRRNANQVTMPINCRNILYQRLMVLNTDARFNKNLIDSCQDDINKYCQNEVIDDDDDGIDDDADDDDNEDRTNDNEPVDGQVQDRDMGGRIINCLRSKYANRKVDLDSKCVIELTDVIQTSKLDVKFDVKLYEKCRTVFDSSCIGLDKEDCLKIKYQKNEITDPQCKEQVIRIIKEGRADVHVDQALTLACQADLIKYCNDIPIGAGKQLQCLLKVRKSVTNDCKKLLTEREQLWKSISDIDDFDDLADHIVKSSNNRYLLSIIIISLILIFLSGCFCRPFVRYSRVSKYK